MKEWFVQHLAEVGFGFLATGFGIAFKKVSKKMSEQESIKLGLQALLRDRIISSYNKHMERGFCPIYARENIDALAKEYFNLGGNGIVHSLLEKLNNLPTERMEEK